MNPKHDNSPELETRILEDFLHYFLPDGLLDYFEPVMAEGKEPQIKKDEVYKRILHLYFDERDNRTEEMQHLRPNGFTEERTISDFPARNRKLVLHIAGGIAGHIPRSTRARDEARSPNEGTSSSDRLSLRTEIRWWNC